MAREIWVFSDAVEYRRRGGIVAIVEPPPESSHMDIELYALQLQRNYQDAGEEVRTVIRSVRSY